jgi:hypothetical protein
MADSFTSEELLIIYRVREAYLVWVGEVPARAVNVPVGQLWTRTAVAEVVT